MKSCTIRESLFSLPSLLSSTPDSPLSDKVLFHLWIFSQFTISVVPQSRLSTVSWSSVPFVNLYSVYHLCCSPVQTAHSQLKSCTICESSVSLPSLLSPSLDSPLLMIWSPVLLFCASSFNVLSLLSPSPRLYTVSWSHGPFVNLIL